MFGIQDFWTFLLAAVLLNLTPGQDSLYVIGRSLAQGRRAGYASALGISSGSLVHTLAAAFGLSALLVTSATAFRVLTWLGAAYLVYLGLRLLLGREEGTQPERPAGGSPWRLYRQGLLTNVLNVKVAVFFLALLPQFIDPADADSPLPFLVLGCCFVCTGTLWCLALAWGADRLGHGMLGTRRARRWLHRAAGSLFILLGARLVLVRA
ncbi:MAG: LysE family translocator [Planctomycetota bacterium]